MEEGSFREICVQQLEARSASHAEFAQRALAAGPLAGSFAAASPDTRAAVTTDVAGAPGELRRRTGVYVHR